ncbi:hypothetical protein HYH03_013032 [Edaphochlamys debaryana]|uniref:Uncharacterized protein n=1 Tax=Edaphochlamys debaryana TaxID=47281 RepID=A0A835XNT7_9CHLO|nr:hypothetical protein HYH03_013032 [Edaphochlamys debaryana]|eukprot:KAG2488342.1 hypothetical protein HYH03_013032 [Edaphochlamys debaryana]
MPTKRSARKGCGEASPAAFAAEDAHPSPVELLERSWGRVASTHDLQTLLAPPQPKSKPGLRSRLLGLLLLGAAVALVSLHTAHAAALLIPGPLQPALLRPLAEYSERIFTLSFVFHGTAVAAFLHWFSRKLFKHNSS